MFKDFHGFGQQMPIRKVDEGPKPLSVAQQARREAIEKLQSDLAKNDPTTSEIVRKKRMEALLTLLSNETNEEFGDIQVPENLMHYSQSPESESPVSAANESNLGEGTKAA